MRLVQWYPFQELVAMNDRLHRTMNDSNPPHSQDSVETWAPPVDVFEKHDRLVLRAEIPGIQKEDMDVQVENGVLTLRGERKPDHEVGEAYRMERTYGVFERSFTLPTTVDGARVTAVYKDGVLEVVVPKIETAKPQKVEIMAA